jgi:hypothetical protein
VFDDVIVRAATPPQMARLVLKRRARREQVIIDRKQFDVCGFRSAQMTIVRETSK